MVGSHVPRREETITSSVISLGETWRPIDPQSSRSPECQGFGLSREDLRLELLTFARETLQVDLLQLQQAIRGDVEKAVLAIQEALQMAQAASCDHVYEMPSEHEVPASLPASCGIFGRDQHWAGPKDTRIGEEPTRCLTPVSSRNSDKEVHFSVESESSSDVSFTPRYSLSSSGRSRDSDAVVRAVSQCSVVTKRRSSKELSTHSWKKSEGAAKVFSKQKLMSKVMGAWQRKLLWLVSHHVADTVIAMVIFIHGIYIGLQTEIMVGRSSEEPDKFFEVSEIAFCMFFTVELTARLLAYRCEFFTNDDKGWNVFELIIVVLQLVELLLLLVAVRIGISFGIIRFIRLMRIVRLARALRLITQLRVLVSCIAASVKPLLWSCILLFMIAYVASVAITQMVHTRRIQMKKDGIEIPAHFDLYWDGLVVSTWTLIQTLTGGIDWNDVARPLIKHVNVEAGIVFTAYILFTHLAMLNVVTGVFIDSVMQHGREEKDMYTRRHVQALFDSLDVNHEGEITWDEFSNRLETRQMQDFFKTVDVDIAHAKELFELLDMTESGTLGVREFMDGCLKIWTPARGIELRMLMRDLSKVQQTVLDNQSIMREAYGCGLKGAADATTFDFVGTPRDMIYDHDDRLPAA